MKKQKAQPDSDRVTVTLAPGQREVLERLAKANGTTLAFIVRYAIKHFIQESEGGQMRLEFPAQQANQ
jgi:predicted DNA-binding protein